MLTGSLLLGAVLTFGLAGIVVNAQQGGDAPYVKDDVYIEECGACHLAYPPGLLPVASWEKTMAGLKEHFGDNAELDQETAAHIEAYLTREALRKGNPSTMSQMLRNLPNDPPLRITELPAFVSAHEPVAEQLDMAEFSEGFLSPCADCHREAAEAVFDKDRLHQGYGPQIWGGAPEQGQE